MTLLRLISTTQGLLLGDTQLPDATDQKAIALVAMALEEVAYSAEATLLVTDDTTEEIIRKADIFGENKYIRRPTLPSSENDEIDINENLCFAVARYIASYVSREKFEIHRRYGDLLIKKNNENVVSMLEVGVF